MRGLAAAPLSLDLSPLLCSVPLSAPCTDSPDNGASMCGVSCGMTILELCGQSEGGDAARIVSTLLVLRRCGSAEARRVVVALVAPVTAHVAQRCACISCAIVRWLAVHMRTQKDMPWCLLTTLACQSCTEGGMSCAVLQRYHAEQHGCWSVPTQRT